ncbi:MAG: type I deoxyribonuclease HsdR [Rhodothermaceae bacterium]|nr:MAG: type I deoxyribonuclease HsdR [Rhodothermaceae bacterium]
MRKYVTAQTSIAPLAVFRVLFGFIMTVSILRFALKGWIHALYVKPTYYFTFYGFDWVRPLGEAGMYALFLLMGLAALGIMLGWHYRLAAVLFFLSFTYVELIDKTNYLNHYYFVSIVSFLLIWVPAHRAFSLDVRRRPSLRVDTVPAWTTGIFKLQLGLVYVYAGLAKLNPDWLFEALPLRLWLPAHAHLPLIGPLLDEPLTAYVFSWAGALYDLTIVFFLLWKRTRLAAYLAVLAFHLTTALLFQIGMFPYIMILCTLIFFPASFHERLIAGGKTIWRFMTRRRAGVPVRGAADRAPVSFRPGRRASLALAVLLGLHFALQILIPLRSILYPGHLFWTEEGYRFSWRVMLMEKAGYTVFRVHDPATGRRWEVPNWAYLTPYQEKMMSTQPDMILQFAHFLEEEYRRQGIEDVEITVEAHVTLNGRKSRLMIDPGVDLTEVKRDLRPKTWILPFTGREESWLTHR